MERIKKFSLFLHISFIALIWTVFQNHEEFSSREIMVFCTYVTALAATQGLVALAINHVSKRAALAFAGIFAAFNVYTLILIHNSFFVKLSGWGVVLSILIIATGIFALLNIRAPKIRQALDRFLLILAGILLAQLLIDTLHVDSFRSIPDHFKFAEFKKRPNVYVITFDAMSPEIAVKANFGVDTDYTTAVRRFGGRVIPNAFAERISTKWSLNSFQAMDLEYFDHFKKKNVLITNRAPNPTYEAFRKNEYKIQFMYVSNFFGDDNGRLDFYGVAQAEGMCMHVDAVYGLGGYCLPQVQAAVKSLARLESDDYPQYLFDRIKKTAKSDESWYTQAHIYTPGHTPRKFNPHRDKDWKEFRKRYKERSAEARDYLETLLKTLKEYDPTAILIVFGDHGPITSRGLLNDSDSDDGMVHNALEVNESDAPKNNLLTYEQIVQDRHGVYLAVFPKSFCQDGFRQNPYSTLRIMRDVLKCLSGEDPLPADFQPNDDHWAKYKYQ